MVAGVVGAVVEVVVPPIDMVPAFAVCSWPTAATSAPRATAPLTAIAATRHLYCLLCISAPPFRSFAASPPDETVLPYTEKYPRGLRFFFGAAGKPLGVAAHQSSPGCSGVGRCARRRRRAAAPSALALRALHGAQLLAQLVGFSSAPPLATLMMWSTCVAWPVHAGPRSWHW